MTPEEVYENVRLQKNAFDKWDSWCASRDHWIEEGMEEPNVPNPRALAEVNLRYGDHPILSLKKG